MAMVTIRALLPSGADVQRLRGLGAPLRISREISEPYAALYLPLYLGSDNDGDSIRLSVEYDDVVFKFEIFNLAAAVAPLPSGRRELATFEHWDQIGCVLAFEWERPALDNEVPSYWEQVVHRRGPRTAISDTATAIGVSMVGVIFGDSTRNRPVGMIYTDASDPCSLLISRNADEIQEFMADCETIAAEEFPKWRRGLKQWCNSRERQFRQFGA